MIIKDIIILSLFVSLMSCTAKRQQEVKEIDREPNLYPQLAGATLPRNIAAPTFLIDEEATYYYTEIGKIGESPAIRIASPTSQVLPSQEEWQKLLESAYGESIYIRVILDQKDRKAEKYRDIICPVEEPIDSFLVYRLLYPGYELWNEMGIYQRDLTSYRQEAVLENKDIDKQCVNCHSFSGGSPETMMIHVRGKDGGTIIRKNGNTKKVDPKCPELENGATYPSWHPSGKYIAYSANNIQQIFHSKGSKTIEVADLSGDMTIYDVENNHSFTIPEISGKEWIETFPNWSPDGETLFFTRAKAIDTKVDYDSLRYDLCKISFDVNAGRFISEPEILINASENKKSISFPRVSPDGKWLLYTLSDYGNFSIWHPESDLWILNLENGETRLINEINSGDVDSYHSWSSDGNWIVFSSKRMDGLWARPFIAHFDTKSGKFGKPFAVPQENPLFYDDFMKTYNVPELVRSGIVDTNELVKAVKEKTL